MKELLTLWRDPILLLFVAYAFTAEILIAGYGISLELRHAALAVVNEDGSQLAARLVQAFRAPYFRPPVTMSVREVDRALDSGRFTFVVDIPPNFQADLLAGRRPQIQINVDATAMSQAYIGASYIERIVARELHRYLGPEAEVRLPIDARIRVKYNPNRESTWFVSVTEMLMMVTMMAVVLPATALLREREHGTIEHLLVMPLSPAEIMLAKVWASSLVVLCGTVFSTVVIVQGVFGAPMHGSMALFLAGTALYQFTTAGLGMVVATVARTTPQMALVTILVLTPMIFLSGAWTPLEALPRGVAALTHLSPLRYYMEFATGIFFRGAGLDVLWPQVLGMAAIGGALFGYALLRFRARFSIARR